MNLIKHLNPISHIREYIAWRIWLHRFEHGRCVACGVGMPLQGALCCRGCFEFYRTRRKP